MRFAERFTGSVAYHGEGPFWDPLKGRLLCMDVFAGVIVEIDSTGRPLYHPVPSRAVSVIRRRSRGGFVLATERGVVFANDELSTFDNVVELTRNPGVRTNDGGCDPLGGFVVGTMAYDATPDCGTVYRMSSTGVISELLAPVSISNGVQWSADGTRAYYTDTPTRRVDTFDVDHNSGEWARRRTHVVIDGVDGVPDGIAIDEDDGLWIALWGGGAVNHYDSTGRLVESVKVPGVSQVSSCTFGGEHRNTLYITTSRQDLPHDHEPDAGAVFAIETGVRGANQAEFAG